MSAVEPSSKPHSQFVEGHQFPAMFDTECIHSAIHYKARSDDFFLVSYPKCGSNWTKQILMLILSHGEPAKDGIDFLSTMPIFELAGSDTAEHMAGPRTLRTHLPFHLIPWNDSAKYLYVTKNPSDCCVSYFHYMRNIPGFKFNGTFDDFFELFISGNIPFGDYFDHLLGWYENRNKPNVMFVTFEEMKERPKDMVLKIASFMDENVYAKSLKEDPEMLENIIKYSTLDYMIGDWDKYFGACFIMSDDDIMKSSLPDKMKTFIVRDVKRGATAPTPTTLRKRKIGDWRNHFSGEQIKRMNEKYLGKTKETEIPKLWEKYL